MRASSTAMPRPIPREAPVIKASCDAMTVGYEYYPIPADDAWKRASEPGEGAWKSKPDDGAAMNGLPEIWPQSDWLVGPPGLEPGTNGLWVLPNLLILKEISSKTRQAVDKSGKMEATSIRDRCQNGREGHVEPGVSSS